MKALKDETGIVKTSRLVALLSFVFGSLILLFFYLTKNTLFMLLGIVFLFGAFILNSILLIALLLKYSEGEAPKDLRISILIILANIPIAYYYYQIAMHIFSTIID
ncbi:hypothetical protein [Olleya sp. Bg11-27]|uniref:hypothetical protein n=1 Tax=Olleya sp. Bg11-27 TaxID=2058135 RepID=UPI000C311A9A|nr:hypothetical protein [Olleya sp. Bg11-27]AUC75270.1 hypothetical protein CW732_06115 [Olleya sp. Bg11-27]